MKDVAPRSQEDWIQHHFSGLDRNQSAAPLPKWKFDESDFSCVPVHTQPYHVRDIGQRSHETGFFQGSVEIGFVPRSIGSGQFDVVNIEETLFSVRDALGDEFSKPHQFTSRVAKRQKWLEIAHEQLNDLDSEADEEGIDRPFSEARAFAEKFIEEFSKKDLPPPSVFPDDERSVSIQIGVKGFIFLLTCFKGGNGIYNAIHDTYRASGSYKDLSVDGISGSPLLQHLQCLMSPLSQDVSLANRTR